MKTSTSLLNEHLHPFKRSNQPFTESGNRKLTPFPAAKYNRFANLLTWVGQILTNWFLPNSEPRITLITDRQGQVWWQINDPRTGELHWCDSEAEARVWIERYYCR